VFEPTIPGNALHMAETREVRVVEVKGHETRSGDTRFVLVDEDGNEYTTFGRRSPAARIAEDIKDGEDEDAP
jgi:hypothetical protein